MTKISVFGAFGFVGGEFCRANLQDVIRIPKPEVVPPTNNILYFISTTDNYNVFDNVTVDIETNLLHLVEVLDACQKTYKNNFVFNFVSSWFVYGKQPADSVAPLTEESLCNPTGFYSITKRAAEQLLISYCETFHIKYRIFRLANVLGSRDAKVSKKKNALQYLIDQLVHNEPIELYNGGNFYRDYIDVRDCVAAIKLAMNQDKYSILNISNGVSHKFSDLIEQAVRISGSSSIVFDKPDTPEFHSIVQSKDIHLDNSRLASLGYSPQHTILETIEEIVHVYKG